MGSVLQVTFAELPPRPTVESETATREVLSYLLNQGREIGGQLSTSHGADHAALFEFAMKSNLLLVLNKPGSSAVSHISNAIATVSPKTGLPSELWQPLLDLLAQGSTPASIRAAVRRLHTDIERHLAEPVEP